ncbi:MAG: hypothetical protein AAF567_22900 [Actinomycetota bacterium]
MSPTFDLAALFAAVDRQRRTGESSWSAVASECGVSANTIRRYATADDAEADGVLAAIRWLGRPPEDFVTGGHGHAEPLPAGAGWCRVDMPSIAAAEGRAAGTRRRTTIQRLVAVAARAHVSIASLTRLSET